MKFIKEWKSESDLEGLEEQLNLLYEFLINRATCKFDHFLLLNMYFELVNKMWNMLMS